MQAVIAILLRRIITLTSVILVRMCRRGRKRCFDGYGWGRHGGLVCYKGCDVPSLLQLQRLSNLCRLRYRTAAVPKNRSSQNVRTALEATMASLIRHRNSLLLPLLAYARHIPTSSAFVSIPSVHPRPVIPYGYFQMSSSSASTENESSKPHIENVLFVECGFGNDSHGQSSTKAAVRACRNAIEFNSIPSINRLVPSGYDGLKLDVILAVPPKYQENLTWIWMRYQQYFHTAIASLQFRTVE